MKEAADLHPFDAFTHRDGNGTSDKCEIDRPLDTVLIPMLEQKVLEKWNVDWNDWQNTIVDQHVKKTK